MYAFAISFLLVCWLAWILMFLRRRRAVPKREAVVMAPAARWGVVIVSASYAIVWAYFSGWVHPGWWRMAGSMIAAPASTGLGFWAVHHLGNHWRIQAGLYADHTLVRTGPYRIVRHPIYTSMFGMLIATGLLLTPWPRFLVAIAVFLIGNEIRIRAEDELLAGRFGDAFAAYRSQVAAFIPYIR